MVVRTRDLVIYSTARIAERAALVGASGDQDQAKLASPVWADGQAISAS